MIQRKTQNPDYWGDEFVITPDDLQYLSTLLVEDELPRSAAELGRVLILYRCQQEEMLIERAMSKGIPYQPKRSYKEGEEVVFPAMDYRVGKVVGTRPGRNPEYGAFQVIQVEFETGKKREFASELTAEHPLNHEPQASVVEDADLHSPEELVEMYGAQVVEKLEQGLESEPDFTRLAGKWFPKDLLVEIHVGHLNLAEAVLDMASGGPLPTEDLLGDLELPEEITPQLRIFSLNYALQEDERFDEVGPAGEVLWFLRRLEPAAVQSAPLYLQYEPLEYDPALLTSEMQALEQQLDDEWSDIDGADKAPGPIMVVLTYPHWKSGTLPLSKQLACLFPTGRTRRIRFTFVDGDTGEEMPGWVVRERRYVCGLEEWYEKHDVLVGTCLELERGEKPGTVIVRPRSRRPRREWVRVALPIGGRLTFETRKQLIACDYDELMIVVEENPQAVEEIWSSVREQGLPLSHLISEIFPELAKLSPQGTVHAAALYSAVNVITRTPPGPLLAELVVGDTYAPVGDNYWVLRTTSDGF
ncbi:MAG: hypothetical protein DRJ03_09015 [Chloroflexi bacterium]|nr:MAG: hypothetical protein B6I35_02640 [Anaerolineaceae bacterium 4572_32.2]RLC81621.1 MAG: hypothetical protein DRI81_01945 [Chloroflexota bacterium]RLC86361.1 MAG: hypothetical protein DRJ03_09015 [Chloroflexota bacterium]HEY73259.1 hypothetical protein [Thermoflexia bacterium]